MFNFEKLDVGNEAIGFADFVCSLTGNFPEAGRFGLTSQMRRAALSTASNIAEGSARSSRPVFARFVEIAAGPVFEVVSQATSARRRGFIETADDDPLYAAAEEQSRMLSGLRKSLLANPV